jgi:hypothetical protein
VPYDRCEGALGSAFIEANDFDDVRWYFALARWTCIPFSIFGGYMCYRLAEEVYGKASGLCALALWCFSPAFLAWGASICPDAVAAGMGVGAIWSFRRWLLAPSWSRAVGAGVFLGILALTKLTWIVAFGLWPLLWLVWRLGGTAGARCASVQPPQLRQLAAILVLALYVVNLGYGFEDSLRPLGQYEFVSKTLAGIDNSDANGFPVTGNRFAGTWLARVPVPIPANMLQGMDTQRYDFERGMPSYLRGEWSDHGWWHYYLYALIVKKPLGTWCLVLLAVGATLFRQGYNAAWRDEMLLLVPFFAIVVFVSSQAGFSVHTRYIMPALPFLFVWTSKVARACLLKRRVVATLLVLSLAWMIASSMSLYPHCLSYFNELAGGPRGGPKHLLGSNVDWGQDLLYLKDWLDEHAETKPLHVALDCSYDPSVVGIQSKGGPPNGLVDDGHRGGSGNGSTGAPPGWYAVSVNRLHDPTDRYRVFLAREPVAMVGYSIHIYQITPGPFPGP